MNTFPVVTLRDYFAAHCPASEIKDRIPNTVGEVANLLKSRGIIKDWTDIIRAYDDEDISKLRIMFRYEYADAMIKARNVHLERDRVQSENLLRVAFEAYLQKHSVSAEKTKDAWGREIYYHPHVQAEWTGVLFGFRFATGTLGKE